MLFTQHDKKSNSVLTINNAGVFYQEMLTEHRKQSKRVKLGTLAIVDGEIMPNLHLWDDYADTVMSHRTLSKKIAAVKSTIDVMTKDDSFDAENVAIKQSELTELESALEFDSLLLENNPISKLSDLDGKILERIGKIINSASFKHKVIHRDDSSVVFTHYQTLESFMESQAKDLAKRFNEAKELAGDEEGYLDIETARETIAKRFDRGAAKLLAKNGIASNTAVAK